MKQSPGGVAALAVAVVVLLGVTACGSGSTGSISSPNDSTAPAAASSAPQSDILHLRGYDISAAAYEGAISAKLTENLLAGTILCRQVTALKTDEARIAFFKQLAKSDNDTSDDELPVGAIPKPGQEPDEASSIEAMHIIVDVCGTLAPAPNGS